MADAPNRAYTTIEEDFINRMLALERQVRELKTTVQPIGSDSIRIGGIPSGGPFGAGPVSIGAGGQFTIAFNFAPTVPNVAQWNFIFDVFVDTHASGFQAPGGTGLSTAQAKCRVSWRDGLSGFSSNRAIAGHTLYLSIENFDASSHNYYIDVYALIPLASGSPIA